MALNSGESAKPPVKLNRPRTGSSSASGAPSKTQPSAGMRTRAATASIAGTRALIEQSIYRDFTRKLAAAGSNLKIGDPHEAGVRVGPLVSAAQRDRVERLQKTARADTRAGGDKTLAETLYLAGSTPSLVMTTRLSVPSGL